MRFFLVVLLRGTASAISAAAQAKLLTTLQPLLDAASHAANISISVGLADGDGGFGATAGVDDRTTGAPTTLRSRFPAGSVTKTYTAAIVMRLHDAGKIDLDKPVAPVIDPFLRRTNGTTLATLWGDASQGGNASSAAMIGTVTARQLMMMRSGLQDYNNKALEAFSLDPAMRAGAGGAWSPHKDITPYDYLA